MTPHDDEELLARFSRRMAAIESEIPSPPNLSSARAGSMTRAGSRRGSPSGWVPAFVMAVGLVALAVIGLRLLPGPGPTPSPPAAGQTTPTPLASPSATTVPSAPPSPTNNPAPSPSPTSSESPSTQSPSPLPTLPEQTPSVPGSGGWIGPARIAKEHYDFVRLVVDGDGNGHVAAVATDGIFYLTDASGSWTRERLTRAPTGGYDGEPSIVIRDDGSLAITFARFGGLQCSFGCVPVDPQGIFLVNNRSGNWSDAVLIIEGRVQEPSLQAGASQLHLAYSRGDEDRTVEYAYAADDTGTWTIEAVGEGESPTLRMGRDGFARISFRVLYGLRNLYYAAQADSGEFVVERVPGNWVVYTQPLLVLDASDEPQIVFFNDIEQSDPNCGSLSVRRNAGRWMDASVVFPEDDLCHVRAEMVDTDSTGTLHVISWYDVSGPGVWYANDAGGAFRALQLREPMNVIDDRPGGGSAMAMDDGGRPHVLYDVYEFNSDSADQPDEDGLWYGIGPAD